MKKRYLAALLLLLVLFSACGPVHQEEPAPPSGDSDEFATAMEEGELAEIAPSTADETASALEAAHTYLPAYLRSEDLLLYTYRDGELLPVEFHLERSQDYEAAGDMGYFLRVFQCTDGRMLYGYEGYAEGLSGPAGATQGPSYYRQNVLYDYESDTHTELGHASYPVVLENGKLALVTFNSLTLFEADGTRSAVQLQFDWGRILSYEDDALIKTRSAGYDYEFYPEHVPVGMAYDAQTMQYIVLHTPSVYMEHTDIALPNEIEYPVFVSLFDESGGHDRTFLVEGLYLPLLNKGYMHQTVNVFPRPNGSVLFENGRIDLATGTWSEGYAELLELVPVLVEGYDKPDHTVYYAQPECPVRIVYHADGTMLFGGDDPEAFLLELDARYTLAFYAFNADGSCNLLFQGQLDSESP